MAITVLTDDYMLRLLCKLLRKYGYSLRISQHNPKYDYIVTGQSPKTSWPIKIGGSAEFCYNTLLENATQ